MFLVINFGQLRELNSKAGDRGYPKRPGKSCGSSDQIGVTVGCGSLHMLFSRSMARESILRFFIFRIKHYKIWHIYIYIDNGDIGISAYNTIHWHNHYNGHIQIYPSRIPVESRPRPWSVLHVLSCPCVLIGKEHHAGTRLSKFGKSMGKRGFATRFPGITIWLFNIAMENPL